MKQAENRSFPTGDLDDKSNTVSRREVLRQIVGAGVCLPFAEALSTWAADAPNNAARSNPSSAATAPAAVLSPEDDQFLDELEHANFLFFWEQGNPNTGLIEGSLQCAGE